MSRAHLTGAARRRYAAAALAALLAPAVFGQAAGDFDGDRRADPAVLQPVNGHWLVRLSGSGYAPLLLPGFLGRPGDTPWIADLDGDGRADPGVYRRAGGDWLARLSARRYDVLVLYGFAGGPDWTPVPADFDGDGRADPALYRPADGTWLAGLSASGYRGLLLERFLGPPPGAPPAAWRPAAADFDGDRRADAAVVDPAAGAWRVRLSADGYRLAGFHMPAAAGGEPVPADYDGDGRADPAVMDPSGGRWLACLSRLDYRAADQPGFLKPADGGTAPADIGLAPGARRRADQLISLFENGTLEIQYAHAEILDDGRGITCGRAGFTTATGDALEVVERYTRRAPGNGLAGYLPELRRLAARRSAETRGLPGFAEAWARAAGDPVFRAVQDGVVEDWYLQPALRHAAGAELRSAIAKAFLYDTIIQHGGGPDPDGLPAILARTPRSGLCEQDWLAAFLQVRRATLAHAHDPSTREAWARTVGRVDVLLAIAATGNRDLDGPIEIDTAGFRATIP